MILVSPNPQPGPPSKIGITLLFILMTKIIDNYNNNNNNNKKNN